MAYGPVGTNDWLVGQIVEMSEIERSSLVVRVLGFATLFVSVIAAGAVMIFIFKRERMLANLDHENRVTLIRQIQPHFMYNVLSAIIALIDIDPATAKKTAYNFSKYTRTNINILKTNEKVKFKDELLHTRTFVDIQKVRFPNEINVRDDIAVDNFLLPPLTLQPIVANAIKHGIHTKRGGTIKISTSETEKAYVITVNDDGAGFDTHSKSLKGASINDVRARLKKMSHGTLKIESIIGEGTTVTITIPKENNTIEEE